MLTLIAIQICLILYPFMYILSIIRQFMKCNLGINNLSTKKFSKFWQNSQNSENFLRFSKCVPIKIFWGKFSEICPASCTKKFCPEISQIFWKISGFKIFVFLSENFTELRFLMIGLSSDCRKTKKTSPTWGNENKKLPWTVFWPYLRGCHRNGLWESMITSRQAMLWIHNLRVWVQLPKSSRKRTLITG